MRDISAGVPTKAPHAPALIPRPAFLKKPGGLPSGFENFSNRYVYTPRKQDFFSKFKNFTFTFQSEK